MTRSEKVLYHQIHPLKLGTDVTFALVSLYFFWLHRLWLALLLHVVPPVVASVLVISFADLERQRHSEFGRYVSRMMTRTVEAVRLAGDLVMVFGAWYHSVALLIGGIAIVLAAWLSGMVWKRGGGPGFHISRT